MCIGPADDTYSVRLLMKKRNVMVMKGLLEDLSKNLADLPCRIDKCAVCEAQSILDDINLSRHVSNVIRGVLLNEAGQNHHHLW